MSFSSGAAPAASGQFGYGQVGADRERADTLGGGGGVGSSEYEYSYLVGSNPRPDWRFLWDFPFGWDEKLRCMDDPIIAVVQRFESSAMLAYALLWTVLTTIEVGFVLPFVVYCVKQDQLALDLTIIMLVACLFTQMPKRFLWRPRPYMVGRARQYRKDKTTSFPSRAVTLSVVYSYFVCYAYCLLRGSWTVEWWMPVIVVISVLSTSFARIYIGAHFPSDCMFGALNGTLISVVGTALARANVTGCTSCMEDACYSVASSTDIDVHSLSRMNLVTLLVGALVCVLVYVLMTVQPLKFWAKSGHAFGLLMPSLLFHLVFLCPNHSGGDSLPAPTDLNLEDFLWAATLGGALSSFGIATKKKVWGFVVLFPVCLVALSYWRLANI